GHRELCSPQLTEVRTLTTGIRCIRGGQLIERPNKHAVMLGASRARECVPARVARPRAELAFDLHESVVFRDAIRAGERARLDLTSAERDGEIGDRRVLGLARAVRDHGGESRAFGESDRVDGLSERSDLIHLYEDRVRRLLLDAPLQTRDAGHEKIVPDDLDPIAERGGELLPPGPVVLRQTVLDRDDWIAPGPVRVERDHSARV